MYWNYDAMENKWYLWNETDDGEEAIAEVGQDEDGTYYWVDLMDADGYCGFDTMDEAKADIEAYFKKH